MPAYGPLCTQFYDADKPPASQPEVDWYEARLPRDAGPVLEPMCGSGRLLLPLVERGLHVHGIDASAAMLASCEARLAQAKLSTALFRQDVRALNVPFRYGAAFIAAGSFQLLPDEAAAQAALLRIRAHLIEPALLLLDLFIPSCAVQTPGAPLVEVRAVNLPDGARITLRSETLVSAEARRVSTRSRYEKRRPGGAIEREDESLAYTWYEEQAIAGLLIETGYRDVKIEPSPRASSGERAFAVRARASV
jgi:hypothetical protein